MGAPTETYKSSRIACCKCSRQRIVEMHYPYEAYAEVGKRFGVPYDVRFEKMGWEFRITKDVGVDGIDRVYVEFVCPECIAEEGEGKQVIKG